MPWPQWILAWATALQPPVQGGESSGPTLQWVAPEGCPAQDEVRRHVAALATSGAPARVASVVVTRAPSEFRATIEIGEGEGREVRSLFAQSCSALADAVVLVLAIDPRRIDAPTAVPVIEPPGPVPTASGPDPVRVDPPAVPPRLDPPVVRARPVASHRIGLGIDAGITWRTVPAFGPTIAGGVAWIGRRWRVDVRAAGTTPRRVRLDAPYDGLYSDISSAVVDLRGAWVPRWRWFELPVHGGVEVGATIARAHGGDHPRTRAAPYFALEAGTGPTFVPLSWLAFHLEASAVVPLVRPAFGVHADGQALGVFETPWVGLRAVAGVEFRVPITPQGRRP